MYYRCEMLYQIPHTCVYNGSNEHIRYIRILKSPASQICLVVQSPASFGRVTCLPPKNASAPWGGPGSPWLTTIMRQFSYIQYLLAHQTSQRSTPYNIVKSALPWSRVFGRRHLGRRVTAVTCLRWPTVEQPVITMASLDPTINLGTRPSATATYKMAYVKLT